jgi:hypothetical protein
MTEFLGEIGKKLAERWVAFLAVPGLLYLAAVTCAVVLGQDHALDFASLSNQITRWAGSATLRSVGSAALIAAAVLAGSVVGGLAAAALGRLTEAIWTTAGRRRPAKWLTDWRRERSREAKHIADDPASSQLQVRKAIARADRICLVEADRPTWVGDRLRASEVRVQRAYGLDLAATWPRLWLLAPESVRTEISAARDSFTASARLAGWAVLYLVLAIWWWPAAPIGVIVGTSSVIKARLAVGDLADLVESAVDLHGRELAVQLGRAEAGPLTAALGKEITTLMGKSRWDPDSPLAD